MMEKGRFFSRIRAENGNAMIYVLIAVALLAALTFVLARQNRSSEQEPLSGEKVGVYAGQIIGAADQVKQVADNMIYSGTRVASMSFCLSGDACFTSANNLFDPDTGGAVLPRLPAEAIAQVDNDPAPGWYVGMFNNVEWTPTTGHDVIMTAHQISQAVCAKINERLTGSTTIPAAGVALRNILIDDVRHSGGNVDFDIADCAACDGHPALCISNGGIYSYYNIIEQQ